MDGPVLRLVLSISVLSLGIACVILGTVAIAIPHWGTFRNRVRDERGNFGPWTICRDMSFGKTTCGNYVSTFKPVFGVYAGGISGAIGIVAIGGLSLATVLQLLSQCHESNVLCSHFTLATIKLINGVIGALLTLVGVCLFATQPDDLEKGFIVEWSLCFYLGIILTTFSVFLLLLTVMEFILARRLPSESQFVMSTRKSHQGPSHVGLLGTTIRNPGVHDDTRGHHHRSTNGSSISMTDSSVRFVLSPSTIPIPNTLTRLELAREISKRAAVSSNRRQYPTRTKSFPKLSSSTSQKSSFTSPTNTESQSNLTEWNNGSVRSLSPTSNGSTLSSSLSSSTITASLSSNPRGPLRSSLKKSKTGGGGGGGDDGGGFGIQNPGFTGTSPTPSRTGSLKKVRIQTQSTDV